MFQLMGWGGRRVRVKISEELGDLGNMVQGVQGLIDSMHRKDIQYKEERTFPDNLKSNTLQDLCRYFI
jgi:hypothetical protein